MMTRETRFAAVVRYLTRLPVAKRAGTAIGRREPPTSFGRQNGPLPSEFRDRRHASPGRREPKIADFAVRLPPAGRV